MDEDRDEHERTDPVQAVHSRRDARVVLDEGLECQHQQTTDHHQREDGQTDVQKRHPELGRRVAGHERNLGRPDQ